LEALADGRWRREERLGNNQPDMRPERVTRGNGAMIGRGAGGWEAAV